MFQMKVFPKLRNGRPLPDGPEVGMKKTETNCERQEAKNG